jgi:MHS family proline/betaine transporter-like MFS transporter
MNKDKKNVIISLLGHVFEHFESSIFTFAGAFTASYFFAQDNSWMGIYGPYIAISSGLILAPFGAFIFSWIGDHLGRRPALLIAYTISIIPSLMIPLIPSHASIGIYASFFLIVARILQGLGGSGAFAGRVILVGESTKKGRNLNMGVLMSLGFFGALLGTGLSSFFMSFKSVSWGWKIPYFMAAVLGVLILLIRRYLSESEEWQESKNKPVQGKKSSIPLIGCLKNYPLQMLCVFFFGLSMLIPFYYGNIWVPKYLEPDSVTSLKYTSLAMIISGLSLILFFIMASYVNLLRFLFFAACAMLFCGFFILIGFIYNPPYLSLLNRVFVALTTGLAIPPIMLLSHRLFPVEYRYTGFAVPFFLGQAFGNGPTPFYAEVLFQSFHSLEITTLLVFTASTLLLCVVVLIHSFKLCDTNP